MRNVKNVHILSPLTRISPAPLYLNIFDLDQLPNLLQTKIRSYLSAKIRSPSSGNNFKSFG